MYQVTDWGQLVGRYRIACLKLQELVINSKMNHLVASDVEEKEWGGMEQLPPLICIRKVKYYMCQVYH